VKSGEHTISVRAPGYKPFRAVFNIKENTVLNLPVKLKAVEKGKGYLHVDAVPSVEVYIDRKYMGTAPSSKPIEVTEGRHEVELKRVGFSSHKQTVVINKEQKTKIHARLKEEF
jgi:hypothetical protein